MRYHLLGATIATVLVLAVGPDPQVSFGQHWATYHFDRATPLNEVNPGFQMNLGRLQLGGYLNSFGVMSFYVARRFDGPLFSTSMGLVTGYALPVAPMYVKTARVAKRLRIGVLPPVFGGAGAIHFGVEEP